MDNIKNLLEYVSTIQKNNDDLVEMDFKPEKLPFSTLNLMYQKILGKERIHSEILGSFLDPNENHGLGVIPLRLFLNEAFEIELENLDISTIKITLERFVTTLENAKRPIDILIEWNDSKDNKKKAIIIENKLNFAVDQINQITDYYNGLISEEYEEVRVMYMPVSKIYKKFKHTDIADNIKEKTIDFDATMLIEWLEKIINHFKIENAESHNFKVDLSGIIQYKIFLEYLKNHNNNKIKAMKIMEILTNEEVIKLENLVNLILSVEWSEARFSGISSKIRSEISEINVSCKKHQDGRNYAQYFFEFNDEYWIELWIEKNQIKLYIVSNNQKEVVSIGNSIFTYDSSFKKYYYYLDKKKFIFNYSDAVNIELIKITTELLKELKKYSKL